MNRVLYLAGVLAVSLALPGCTELVKELKDDPAILGATGFYVSIGFDPSPQNSFFPLPHVKLGNGTAWRVGIHDCVYVTTAAGASAFVSANQAAIKQTVGPTAVEPVHVSESSGTLTSDTPPKEVAGQATGAGGRANLASCIPVGTAPSDPSAGDAGGAGYAYLTIVANGQEAVKLRWSKDADLARQLADLIRDKQLTGDQAIEILRLVHSAQGAKP